MFIYMLVSTAFRVVDLIVVLGLQELSLPIFIIVDVVVLILLGIFLIFRKATRKLGLSGLLLFSLVSIAFISINIAYIAYSVQISLSIAESLLVGSILEIIIHMVFIYYAGKRLNRQFKWVKRGEPLKDEQNEEN